MDRRRDALSAVLAAAVVLGLGLLENPSDVAARAAASLGVAAPLAVRRRLPLTAAVLSAAATIVGAVALPDWPGSLVAVAAFGSAAYHRHPLPVLLLSVGWQVVLKLLAVKPDGAATFADLILLGIAPVAVGYALRLHRERAEQAESLYREETRRVVAEEHARIAREVHDAVGHHLTAIRMQANAVRHVVHALPPAAEQALGSIADSSAAALAEVRGVLDVLRHNGATLADLPALIDRSPGPVTLTRTGSTDPLPALVDHTGYRLAQEALTNALKHAAATRIDVAVHQDRHSVTITVADDGKTPYTETEGAGLRGMRERTRLLGGTLRVTAARPHGRLVEARLPLGAP
ncbi:signal transduction histidine kinase [Saccharothrix tamanrassetensis]|uniref:histidine kinase n=1 Tax=Saccharothrix tamanrassetensis TaxID=1051531 RepID=A0A841CJC0_9PSEU|nr:sensor histidine kinase [Saccharothrix tamanrassetensis]MBB5955746.1 signal transduction histidine kinase [Saccharothrix tamanrassetensis]